MNPERLTAITAKLEGAQPRLEVGRVLGSVKSPRRVDAVNDNESAEQAVGRAYSLTEEYVLRQMGMGGKLIPRGSVKVVSPTEMGKLPVDPGAPAAYLPDRREAYIVDDGERDRTRKREIDPLISGTVRALRGPERIVYATTHELMHSVAYQTPNEQGRPFYVDGFRITEPDGIKKFDAMNEFFTDYLASQALQVHEPDIRNKFLEPAYGRGVTLMHFMLARIAEAKDPAGYKNAATRQAVLDGWVQKVAGWYTSEGGHVRFLTVLQEVFGARGVAFLERMSVNPKGGEIEQALGVLDIDVGSFYQYANGNYVRAQYAKKGLRVIQGGKA